MVSGLFTGAALTSAGFWLFDDWDVLYFLISLTCLFAARFVYSASKFRILGKLLEHHTEFTETHFPFATELFLLYTLRPRRYFIAAAVCGMVLLLVMLI